MTASRAFPNVDGGSAKSGGVDTSATYKSGSGDYVNFFTCSYHYTGSSFDGCMGGGSQSVQLTFSITAVDTDKATGEILWNRCESQADCLTRWPKTGVGGGGDIGNKATRAGNSATYYHQMGSRDANNRATSRCGSKGGNCKWWHSSNFASMNINKGSASNMNNAGSSGVHDSLMMNPSRQATKYWSDGGSSGGASKSATGGIDIDMIERDYGAGWYRATIGGFGCETDTDTTWFRIKKGGCGPGQKCSDGTTTKNCGATCVNCIAGQYGTNGQGCTNCIAGKYLSSTGATSATQCANCGNGHGSSAGANACSICAAGKKASSGAPCSDCATGKMSYSGATTCSACSAGYSCCRFNLFLYRQHNTVPTNSHVLTSIFFSLIFSVFVLLLLFCLVFLLRHYFSLFLYYTLVPFFFFLVWYSVISFSVFLL